jgi:hypothetical protein
LKSSRQIDADRHTKLGALYGRGSGINGAKSCILGLSWHLISLLKLYFFVLFFSYFQQLFKIKKTFFLHLIILWQWFRHFNLLTTIKILFLQCNLTWKTEQLTNYKCSLNQYGDKNDSEVLLYTDLPTLTILAYGSQFFGLSYALTIVVNFLSIRQICSISGPSFYCGSVYYRSYQHFRLLKKRCQDVKILIINTK